MSYLNRALEQMDHDFMLVVEQALREEIKELKAQVDLWKDRCMAVEQAHDATVEHYEQLLNREY